ncbi:ATP-binding cassette domain-containing protein [Sorangium sp. So ce388]|uniref:ATP-binding cassette domain-containing protein n=1 Tax=Sorangium sp. So ce388 TaxID=3133309 RepID=UPI003F5C3F58
MSRSLEDCSWPVARLGEAVAALAQRGHLAPRGVAPPVPPADLLRPNDNVPLERWIEAAAQWLGIEADLIEVSYAELSSLLRAAGPSLLRLTFKGSLFLAVLRSGRRSVTLLCPDLSLVKVPAAAVRDALTAQEDAPALDAAERLIERARIPARRRQRVARAILKERSRAMLIRRCWHLRLPPGAAVARHASHSRALRDLGLYLGAHAAAYSLWIVSWALIGKGALQDRLDDGWLLAWGLLLLTLIPCRLLVTWMGGALGIGAGTFLKQRLLAGVLALRPDTIRRRGAGQLLGQVLESTELETLGIDGGLAAVTALVELAVAIGVLSFGAAGAAHGALLAAWIAVVLALGWRYVRRRGRWTEERLSMTHDLVERLVGHRTRLAQERADRWHEDEDQALAAYLERSRELDRSAVPLTAVAQRGWLILGVLGAAVPFVLGETSPAALAVSIAGVLLGQRALGTLVTGLWQLGGAAVAWNQVAALYHAPEQVELAAPPRAAPDPAEAGDGPEPRTLLEAHDLAYQHEGRARPVLDGCSLRIGLGDRLLLEGPSGSGKSTLASLLAGLNLPSRGLLLLDGLDRRTLGLDGWRGRVVAAPQFHENHVFSNTLAFNLLMGRSWPPRPGDLDRAEAICRKLKLDGVLARMPAGMQQIVGEMGWQLSHGERSRLYIARALLQGAPLLLLDESFAALDPETLRDALQCVIDEAPALLVIAHQ